MSVCKDQPACCGTTPYKLIEYDTTENDSKIRVVHQVLIHSRGRVCIALTGCTYPVPLSLYYLCGKTIFQCKRNPLAGNYGNGIFKNEVKETVL